MREEKTFVYGFLKCTPSNLQGTYTIASSPTESITNHLRAAELIWFSVTLNIQSSPQLLQNL